MTDIIAIIIAGLIIYGCSCVLKRNAKRKQDEDREWSKRHYGLGE